MTQLRLLGYSSSGRTSARQHATAAFENGVLEIRALGRIVTARYGIFAEFLMENAAHAGATGLEGWRTGP
jgi:hypothetical protein